MFKQKIQKKMHLYNPNIQREQHVSFFKLVYFRILRGKEIHFLNKRAHKCKGL